MVKITMVADTIYKAPTVISFACCFWLCCGDHLRPMVGINIHFHKLPLHIFVLPTPFVGATRESPLARSEFYVKQNRI
jgi:hypothetical protein